MSAEVGDVSKGGGDTDPFKKPTAGVGVILNVDDNGVSFKHLNFNFLVGGNGDGNVGLATDGNSLTLKGGLNLKSSTTVNGAKAEENYGFGASLTINNDGATYKFGAKLDLKNKTATNFGKDFEKWTKDYEKPSKQLSDFAKSLQDFKPNVSISDKGIKHGFGNKSPVNFVLTDFSYLINNSGNEQQRPPLTGFLSIDAKNFGN